MIRWLTERPSRTRLRDYDGWQAQNRAAPSSSTISARIGFAACRDRAQALLTQRRRRGEPLTRTPEEIAAIAASEPAKTTPRRRARAATRRRRMSEARELLIAYAKNREPFTAYEAVNDTGIAQRTVYLYLTKLADEGTLTKTKRTGGNGYLFAWAGP